MDTQAVLKAGLVGAAIIGFLALLSVIPCVGCFTFFINLAVYVGIGILAVHWMILPKNTNSGATNGALAAAVAAVAGGFVNGIIQAGYFAITGSAQVTEALTDLPPEQLAVFAEAGIDPAMFAGGAGIAAVLGVSAFCCCVWVVIAAALGAGGGAVWAGRESA